MCCLTHCNQIVVMCLGCQDQGTSETSYLCKPCFAQQQEMRRNTSIDNKNRQQHNDKVTFPGTQKRMHYPSEILLYYLFLPSNDVI